MAFETAHTPSPDLDVPRLLHDLGITQLALSQIAELEIPDEIYVTSGSAIKLTAVGDAFAIADPQHRHEVVGVRVPSGIDEQPLGIATVQEALNRLNNGKNTYSENDSKDTTPRVWVSIENGLFRCRPPATIPSLRPFNYRDSLLFSQEADLSSGFDPESEYEDRAVAAVAIPGYPTIVQLSPSTEAVQFPRSVIKATADSKGGFTLNTVGSRLAQLGLIADKQNPHTELSRDRSGGPLPRQDQMARVVIRALQTLTTL